MAIFMNHHSVVFYFSLKALKMLGLQKKLDLNLLVMD